MVGIDGGGVFDVSNGRLDRVDRVVGRAGLLGNRVRRRRSVCSKGGGGNLLGVDDAVDDQLGHGREVGGRKGPDLGDAGSRPLGKVAVDGLLARLEVDLDVAVKQPARTLRLRQLQPQEEQHFHLVIERNPRDKQGGHHLEKRKAHPVRQPLLAPIQRLFVKSLERLICCVRLVSIRVEGVEGGGEGAGWRVEGGRGGGGEEGMVSSQKFCEILRVGA